MNLVNTCPNAAALLMSIPAYIGENENIVLGTGRDLTIVADGVMRARAHHRTMTTQSDSVILINTNTLKSARMIFKLADDTTSRLMEQRRQRRIIEAREFLESLNDELE